MVPAALASDLREVGAQENLAPAPKAERMDVCGFPCDEDPIHALPAEMRLEIYSHLSREDFGRLALLAKKWNSIVHDLWLWHSCLMESRDPSYLVPKVDTRHFNITSRENRVVCRIARRMQYGPYAVEWSTEPDWTDDQTLFCGVCLTPVRGEMKGLIQLDWERQAVRRSSTHVFQPKYIYGFSPLAIAPENMGHWVNRFLTFKKGTSHSPGDLPMWNDIQTGREWQIEKAEILSKSAYMEFRDYYGENVNRWELCDPVEGIRSTTTDRAALRGLFSRVVVPLDDERFGVCQLKTNVDLPYLLYSRWRYVDE
ncbi:MAG: F-box protein [Holosporales bacterium]